LDPYDDYFVYDTARTVEYDGNYFDSWTEARWAAYFDGVGISWIREPCRFRLEYAGIYTPDFFLPEQNLYVEVKSGIVPWDTRHKLRMLAFLGTVPVMLVDGRPPRARVELFSLGRESLRLNGDAPDVTWSFTLGWHDLLARPPSDAMARAVMRGLIHAHNVRYHDASHALSAQAATRKNALPLVDLRWPDSEDE
jgi:hypothetical protein